MAAATVSTSLVPVQPVFTNAERLALAGFLAGYRGLTREAYTLDLRQFTGWCRARSLPLFSVRRADIETFARELEALGRGTLVITRKGGKVVTIPLAPRTARAIDLAIGERTSGPLFLAGDGRRLDRHGAARIVRRVTRRAQIAKHVGPHTLRHAFITAALDAGVPLRDVQEAASHADPRTTMRYDRARTSLDRHATYIVATCIVATYIAGAAR
jgi:site-specific recombinase XerD